jgi:glyoxalase superfamily protein
MTWLGRAVDGVYGGGSRSSIAEVPSRLLALIIDAHDPARLARFWAGVLGRVVLDGSRDALLPGADTQVGLRFARSEAEKDGPNRVHLHLTSTSPADQQDRVAAALELGARHLDVGQLPEEGHVVLADPEGNEFCVIEPDSSFLAGCGLLGELACDGTRQVGLFWADVLGWPLVWDEGQETAIQSPHGGTKLAWGGPPLAPKQGRNRQRFDLTPADGDLAAEVDRLVALGASRLGRPGDGSVELADPDGNEFRLTQA